MTEDLFIVRPFPSSRECRWMAYHLMVYADYTHEKDQHTNNNILQSFSSEKERKRACNRDTNRTHFVFVCLYFITVFQYC